ncbi:HNH endonuclease [Burkholderia multivorans]|uniref:HNH endonuclease n=1 Tax=Burkholderia multivorans TaxID=87883 RepID=UPI0021BE1E04|nr:HNH endonuclease [Burkholderia multivorans]MDR9052062.1 hypothetical protein [Burkholderia multivorans]MDR9060134.1 hypothetical protein [Burkholderia multivorans]MDR9062439.1 hypothetical protein [Burkholderia multivorans]MDR9072213.1 hypothetical protein [Burkholderia multivorans]MDR9076538.1 hypothetical protein [Burkholderia multivorans]
MAVSDCGTKFCPKCKTEKLAEEFARSSRRADGRAGVCKACVRLASSVWRSENREKHREGTRDLQRRYKERNAASSPSSTKRCPRCNAILPASHFFANTAVRDGLSSYCRDCTRARYRLRDPEKRKHHDLKYQLVNRERINARQRQFYRDNKELFLANNRRRKARLKSIGGVHSRRDITALLVKQKYRCAYCRVSLRRKYHVDHVKPLKLGGSNDPTNLQVLCPRCNLRKGAKDPIQYANSIGLLF